MNVCLNEYRTESFNPYKVDNTRLDFTVEMPFDELFEKLKFHEDEKLSYDALEYRVKRLVYKAFMDCPVSSSRFEAKKVIFSGKCTIILWKDGTKTKVTCGEGDTFDPEKGIAMCFMKKALGNKGNFNYALQKCKSSFYGS